MRLEKGRGRSAERHYATMTLADIMAMPVAEMANPRGCALFMWVTAPLLSEGIYTLRAWGFTYKTRATWGKLSRTGAKIAFGTGYILRSADETLLIGPIGRPPVLARDVRSLTLAPVREHSRKPDETRTMVQRLFAGPYLELFSRQAKLSWDAFGNEPNKFCMS